MEGRYEVLLRDAVGLSQEGDGGQQVAVGVLVAVGMGVKSCKKCSLSCWCYYGDSNRVTQRRGTDYERGI